MRLIDSPWLTDENIHPEVSLYLRSRGLDVQDVKEQRWHGRSDEDLIDEAYRSGRIILTHDGDFGTLALLRDRPVFGIVRVRPGHFRAAVTIEALDRLLALSLDVKSPFLIVVQGGFVRIRTWG